MKGVPTEEASKNLGVTARHIQQLIRAGRLRVTSKRGNVVLLNPNDVEREAMHEERLREIAARIERM